MTDYKYISEDEFPRCTPPCKITDMDPFFLERLDVARHIAGIAFIFSSAFRTVEHELAQGRDGTSTHTKGRAIDITYSSSSECFKIVQALMQVRFTRIIIYKSWIHVDADKDKLSPMLKIKD